MYPQKKIFSYGQDKLLRELKQRQEALYDTALGLNLSVLSLTGDISGEYSEQGLRRMLREIVKDFLNHYHLHSYPETFMGSREERAFTPLDLELYETYLYLFFRTAQAGLRYIRSPESLVRITEEEDFERFLGGVSVLSDDSFLSVLRHSSRQPTFEDATETYVLYQPVSWDFRMTASTLYEFLTEGKQLDFPNPFPGFEDKLIEDYGSIEAGRQALSEKEESIILRNVPGVYISPVYSGYEELERTPEEAEEEMEAFLRYENEKDMDFDPEEGLLMKRNRDCQLLPEENEEDRTLFLQEGKRIRRSFYNAEEYIEAYERLFFLINYRVNGEINEKNAYRSREDDFVLCLRWMFEDFLKDHGLTIYAQTQSCAKALASIGRASDIIKKAQRENGYD